MSAKADDDRAINPPEGVKSTNTPRHPHAMHRSAADAEGVMIHRVRTRGERQPRTVRDGGHGEGTPDPNRRMHAIVGVLPANTAVESS